MTVFFALDDVKISPFDLSATFDFMLYCFTIFSMFGTLVLLYLHSAIICPKEIRLFSVNCTHSNSKYLYYVVTYKKNTTSSQHEQAPPPDETQTATPHPAKIEYS